MFPCFGVLEIFIEDFKKLIQNKSVLQIYPDDKAPIASDALLGTGAFLIKISNEEHKHCTPVPYTHQPGPSETLLMTEGCAFPTWSACEQSAGGFPDSEKWLAGPEKRPKPDRDIHVYFTLIAYTS